MDRIAPISNIIVDISAASVSVVSDGESKSVKTAKNSNRKRIFKKNTNATGYSFVHFSQGNYVFQQGFM